MNVKLKDIAAAAGVSISTVSRVLSQDPVKRPSVATAKRVIETAKRLGYDSEMEKSIRERRDILSRKTAIGCVIISEFESFRDAFFSSILDGVKQEAKKMGISLKFALAFSDDPSEFDQKITSTDVDGIVLMGRISQDQLNFMKAHFPSIVYAGLSPVGHDIDEVICDIYDATCTAMNHLFSLNHKTIGFLGTVPDEIKDNVINEYRYAAYCQSLTSHQLPIDKNHVRHIPLTTKDGFQAMKDLIQTGQLPSAVFCSNDNVAIGAIRAIADAGLAIPKDISVISIDNTGLGSYIRPSLTTVDVPKEELGRFAVKLLEDRITSQRNTHCVVSFPHQLIVRESSDIL